MYFCLLLLPSKLNHCNQMIAFAPVFFCTPSPWKNKKDKSKKQNVHIVIWASQTSIFSTIFLNTVT